MNLKWNKAEWIKDRQVGTWIHPRGDGGLYIEQQLDKFHKSLWYKVKDKKLVALNNLHDVVTEYKAANTNEGALKIINQRLKQVDKKILQYGDVLKFLEKLTVPQILDNPYLGTALKMYMARMDEVDGVNFLVDVWGGRNRQFILDLYIVQGAPRSINISSEMRNAILAGGDFKPAIEEVIRLIKTNYLVKFKQSDELKNALPKISKFNR